MRRFLLRSNKLCLFLVFLSLFLIFADKKSWLQSPKSLLQRPFIWAEERIFSSLSDWQRPQQEVQRLEGELRQMAVEQNQLAACQEENEKMRKLLGAPLPPKWKFLDARVIGLVSGQMRINKGEEEGIKKDANVISENILVGKVVDVGVHDAWVQIVSSPATKIPVVVKKVGSSGIQARGLLITQGGELILDRVLQSEDIRKGDLVVSAGEAGWLPELLIGTIKEVLPKSPEVYQKAKVESLIDYDKLRIVFVVR